MVVRNRVIESRRAAAEIVAATTATFAWSNTSVLFRQRCALPLLPPKVAPRSGHDDEVGRRREEQRLRERGAPGRPAAAPITTWRSWLVQRAHAALFASAGPLVGRRRRLLESR
jgi:hypothetical protein